MSEPIQDGGAAFPLPPYSSSCLEPARPNLGMTLRDYFADNYTVQRNGEDMCLLGYGITDLCETLGIKLPTPGDRMEWICAELQVEARLKFMFADAMLAAREARP